MSMSRMAATLVGIAGIVVGAIQAAKPEALGISPIVSAWLGVLGAVLAGVQVFLPAAHRASDR